MLTKKRRYCVILNVMDAGLYEKILNKYLNKYYLLIRVGALTAEVYEYVNVDFCFARGDTERWIELSN